MTSNIEAHPGGRSRLVIVMIIESGVISNRVWISLRITTTVSEAWYIYGGIKALM